MTALPPKRPYPLALTPPKGILSFVVNCGAIDVAHPRLDSFCDHQRTGYIAAEDCGGETKLGVIGDTHGVCLILGANDGNDPGVVPRSTTSFLE